MNKPAISIFIPYYNDEIFLGAAIESVLSQTFSDFELVLLNHASTDSSRSVAHSYTDPRIVHIDMPYNLGAGGGVLLGAFLERAQGEYLKLFCADDLMLPSCLADCLEFIRIYPQTKLLFGDMEYMDQTGKSLGKTWFSDRYSFEPDRVSNLRLFFEAKSIFPYPASFIRRDTALAARLDKVSIFMMDMGFWVSLMVHGAVPQKLNRVLVRYRIHEGQVSSVSQRAKAVKACIFEPLLYIRSFLDIREPLLLAQLWPDNEFAAALNEQDADLVPFVVAQQCVREGNSPSYVLAGRLVLVEQLSNPVTAARIWEKFAWNQKQLRMLYMQKPVYLGFVSYNIKQLGLGKLASLFFRKLYNRITLREWRKARRERRQTSDDLSL